MLSKATLVFGFALAVAVLPVLACEPSVPANPSYMTDVAPIFAAHCVRCHGETLTEGDPGRGMPVSCHLNRFEDAGDCSSTGVMMRLCNRGAQFCASMVGAFTVLTDDPLVRMPPPPADPLSDWAKEVITRWSADPRP